MRHHLLFALSWNLLTEEIYIRRFLNIRKKELISLKKKYGQSLDRWSMDLKLSTIEIFFIEI